MNRPVGREFKSKFYFLSIIFSIISFTFVFAQEVTFKELKDDNQLNLVISNPQISYTVIFDGKNLFSNKITSQKDWANKYGESSTEFETDGNFAFDIMYADWRAPGKQNNGDNPVLLDKNFFSYEKYEVKNLENGVRELRISFAGKETTLHADLILRLAPNDFYIRRKIVITDAAEIGHMLRFIYPVYSVAQTKFDILNNGGFGQPVAFTTGDGGAFYGIEYPGSTNKILKTSDDNNLIQCGHEYGQKIGTKALESDWCVIGMSPDEYIKKWFMRYIDDIRIKKLEPFTLYNSWYDLRSADYPNVVKENVMNEQNSLRIIDLLQKNMVQKNNIKLDAFVLDDGWDVYKSDWALRDKQFPKGFTPLVNELKKTNTTLGLWFGPTGGYSFRMDRINWMREHGYETVGKGKDFEMLCLGGKKYGSLFTKRITEFEKKYGVGYYKWDGIQFSCNEASHGHPIDIYSRRAIIDSLLDKIKAVRNINPDIYLNITSGTWLSPWWVKYANQIWMDGGDYGYADVPSISPRDAAITYRDMVLYENFHEKNLWFPVANLMTHGIIKGKLQMLGGENEPIEKFSDESLMYFARGVSMWELYISPDIMSDEEWNVIAKSIHWARDRFPVLQNTFMIGGNPKKGETYAYVHFENDHGIIAARNPVIANQELNVSLDPANGFAKNADSLIVEEVYPYRWIAPQLYSSGDKINLDLDGFETAVFEVYPLSSVKEPLIGGVLFERQTTNEKNEVLSVFHSSDARLLNPSTIDSVVVGDSTYVLSDFSLQDTQPLEPLISKNIESDNDDSTFTISAELTVDSSVISAQLAVLIKPGEDYLAKSLPAMKFFLHDEEVKPQSNSQEGKWDWYILPMKENLNNVKIKFAKTALSKAWAGPAAFWFICNQKQKVLEIKIASKNPLAEKILPYRPYKSGELQKNILLDEVNVKLSD